MSECVTHQVRPLTQARLCADPSAAGGWAVLGGTECGSGLSHRFLSNAIISENDHCVKQIFLFKMV